MRRRVWRDAPVVVEAMRGLGDNIYLRAVVQRSDRPVILMTPWPQLYTDLPGVECVKPLPHRLRTQRKNEVATPPGMWGKTRVAHNTPRLRPHYGRRELAIPQTILRSLELSFGTIPDAPPIDMNLPKVDARRLSGRIRAKGRPIAMIRPVTIRKEWQNESRAPLPEYIYQVAARLMDTHHVVLVGDVAHGAEWLLGDMPPHHQAFMGGELDILDILALMKVAAVSVGGVGWIVPAAMASKRPTFVILGGNGGHNSPAVITDKRIHAPDLGFARPKRFCACTDMTHHCNKEIPDLIGTFERWAEKRRLKL
jgi:hypothetical protein